MNFADGDQICIFTKFILLSKFDKLTKFVNKKFMLDKQRTILTSAYNVFCRYGVKRATMNDIATEAGVARQTLYNTFNNKETIIQAIMLHYTEATLAEIEAFQTSDVPFEDVSWLQPVEH